MKSIKPRWSQLADYAWEKLLHPRSIGHLCHGWAIVFVGAVFGVAWGFLTATLCLAYQVAEGISLMYHGTHTDNTEETAGIDYYGIVAGFYQAMVVFAVIKLILLLTGCHI